MPFQWLKLKGTDPFNFVYLIGLSFTGHRTLLSSDHCRLLKVSVKPGELQSDPLIPFKFID